MRVIPWFFACTVPGNLVIEFTVDFTDLLLGFVQSTLS